MFIEIKNKMDLNNISNQELLDLVRQRNLEVPVESPNPSTFLEQLRQLDQATRDDLSQCSSLRNALQGSKTKLFDLTFQQLVGG